MEEMIESGLLQQKLAAELRDIEGKEAVLRDAAEKMQQKLINNWKENAEIVGNRLEAELESFQKAVTQSIRSLSVSFNDFSARIASGLAVLQSFQAKIAEIDAQASSQMSKGKELQRTLKSTVFQGVTSLESRLNGLNKRITHACTCLQSSKYHLEVTLTALNPTEVRVKVHNRRFYSIKEAKIRVEMGGRVVDVCDLPIIRGSSEVEVAICFTEEKGGKRLQLTAVLNSTAISPPLDL